MLTVDASQEPRRSLLISAERTVVAESSEATYLSLGAGIGPVSAVSTLLGK